MTRERIQRELDGMDAAALLKLHNLLVKMQKMPLRLSDAQSDANHVNCIHAIRERLGVDPGIGMVYLQRAVNQRAATHVKKRSSHLVGVC